MVAKQVRFAVGARSSKNHDTILNMHGYSLNEVTLSSMVPFDTTHTTYLLHMKRRSLLEPAKCDVARESFHLCGTYMDQCFDDVYISTSVDSQSLKFGREVGFSIEFLYQKYKPV